MDRNKHVEPKRKESKRPTHEWSEEHPSYAHIQVSRMQCGGTGSGMNLFGSPITHREIIALRISGCEAVRSLNHTWYHSKNQFIEVYMSPVQFADLITQMNASGTPCTLNWFKGEGEIPQCPEEKPSELMQQEFNNSMRETKKEILQLEKQVEELLAQTKISKVMKKSIMGVVGRLRNKMRDHFPFMASQFSRQMNKTASAAKAEVDAFITGKIQETGMKELGMELPDTKLIETAAQRITPLDELQEKMR